MVPQGPTGSTLPACDPFSNRFSNGTAINRSCDRQERSRTTLAKLPSVFKRIDEYFLNQGYT